MNEIITLSKCEIGMETQKLKYLLLMPVNIIVVLIVISYTKNTYHIHIYIYKIYFYYDFLLQDFINLGELMIFLAITIKVSFIII